MKPYLYLIGAMLGYMLGGWDAGIQTLLTLCCIDYVTGILKAIYQKRLNSAIGARGIIKKVCYFLAIAACVAVERIAPGGENIHNAAAFAFSINEIISIIENVGTVGVKIPDALKQYFTKLKEGQK